MNFGQKLKNGFSNNKKLILYLTPLFERICAFITMIFLSLMVIAFFFVSQMKSYELISCLLFILGIDIYIICELRSYIAIDFDSNNLIICEFPGSKREIISLYQIQEMKLSFDPQEKLVFTIDILQKNGDILKIYSWGGARGMRHLYFNSFKRQTQRIKKFLNQCNTHINSII